MNIENARISYPLKDYEQMRSDVSYRLGLFGNLLILDDERSFFSSQFIKIVTGFSINHIIFFDTKISPVLRRNDLI